MEYLFLLGRILYGGFFILAGINHFRHLTMLATFAAAKNVPSASFLLKCICQPMKNAINSKAL